MESSVFDARVLDTARLCYQSGVPRFLGFLSPAEAALAVKALTGENVRYCFFGGFEGAERTMLGCLPDWCENPEFPITAVTFCFRKQDSVSHRDVLGTLMTSSDCDMNAAESDFKKLFSFSDTEPERNPCVYKIIRS